MTHRHVLVVDDKPDVVGHALNSTFSPGTKVTVLHPQDVEEHHLTDARLILVDFVLAEDWPLKNLCTSASPRDGSALIAVYRSVLRQADDPDPRAFVLLTSQADVVAPKVGLHRTRFAAARFHGFDWMLDQTDDQLSGMLSSICDAIYSLDSLQIVSDAVLPQDLLEWLQAPTSVDGEYSIGLLRALDSCHPPVDDIAADTHRVSILRWLLHRVLPYPSMLYGDYELACRLGVEHESLLRELKTTGKFADCVSKSLYVGPASALVGRRWWAAHIDQTLLELANGRSIGRDSVWEAVLTLDPAHLKQTESQHVPVINPEPDELVFAGTAPIEECVRVHPDEWPAFADDAWARLADVGPGNLVPLSLVVIEDRARVEDAGDDTTS